MIPLNEIHSAHKFECFKQVNLFVLKEIFIAANLKKSGERTALDSYIYIYYIYIYIFPVDKEEGGG